MLRKHKLVSAEAIKSLQAGDIDPKTVAKEALGNLRNYTMIAQMHPWTASNDILAQHACFSLSLWLDRIAEAMLSQLPGAPRLPVELQKFIETLSVNAIELLRYSKELLDAPEHVVFTEEVRMNLFIANNMPPWPECRVIADKEAIENEKNPPYGRSAQVGYVTVVFLQALARAVVDALHELGSQISQTESFPVSVPVVKYSGLVDYAKDEQKRVSKTYLRASETLESLDDEHPDEKLLADVYQKLYSALVDTITVCVGLWCPAILNDSMALTDEERKELGQS